MMERRAVTIRVLRKRTHVNTTLTTTLPDFREGFKPVTFSHDELLTVIHQVPTLRHVTRVITRDNYLLGGWDVINARTNEVIARINSDFRTERSQHANQP